MIGIFGGTFDPVHYGHLKTVAYVLEQLDLEQVRLIPLGQAVHREQPIASAQQRIALLQAATAGNQQLFVDDREAKRSGGSYSVQTLASIKQEMPDKTFCLIVGSDAFAGFSSWYQPETILSLAHIIVMQRPETIFKAGLETEHLLHDHVVSNAEALSEKKSGGILFQPVPQLDISSTQIRERIRNNQPISELTPTAVAELINQWALYKQ